MSSSWPCCRFGQKYLLEMKHQWLERHGDALLNISFHCYTETMIVAKFISRKRSIYTELVLKQRISCNVRMYNKYTKQTSSFQPVGVKGVNNLLHLAVKISAGTSSHHLQGCDIWSSHVHFEPVKEHEKANIKKACQLFCVSRVYVLPDSILCIFK